MKEIPGWGGECLLISLPLGWFYIHPTLDGGGEQGARAWPEVMARSKIPAVTLGHPPGLLVHSRSMLSASLPAPDLQVLSGLQPWPQPALPPSSLPLEQEASRWNC